jgi:hypothetical protein
VHLLQNKGYPVQSIYEKELKHISTLRIQEFLDEKEQEHYEQEYGGPELDDKYSFSFHTDDSFEPIDDGPMLRPIRPDFVPMLDLEGLPGYETSSDEEEEEEEEPYSQHKAHEYQSQGLSSQHSHAQSGPAPIHYQESMKYIQDFYDKYHSQYDQKSAKEPNNLNHEQVVEHEQQDFVIKSDIQLADAPLGEDSIQEDIETGDQEQ